MPNTFDLDFQHHVHWGRRQDLSGDWATADSDHIADDFRISFQPHDLVTQIFSSFVQDEIAIGSYRLYVSLETN